ncbi:fimbrial protein [Cronobacter muytjensii]|uniref:fimbrial protein n=1 Tax=Cronobacter muytjensii TaxID=413501 RepID=UPI0034D4C7C7
MPSLIASPETLSGANVESSTFVVYLFRYLFVELKIMGKFKALVIAMAAVPMFSFAADGGLHDIKFTGEVSGETCSITVNGDEGGEVKMPTVSTADLSIANATAGETDFTIKVGANCIAIGGSGDVPVNTIIKAANGATVNGNLANEGTASEVEVMLKDPNGKQINLASGANVDGLVLNADGSGGEITMKAAYFTESGLVTPGTVIAPAQFGFSMP